MTSQRNITLKSYKLAHLIYKLLLHYLAKCKSNFTTVFDSNLD